MNLCGLRDFFDAQINLRYRQPMLGLTRSTVTYQSLKYAGDVSADLLTVVLLKLEIEQNEEKRKNAERITRCNM